MNGFQNLVLFWPKVKDKKIHLQSLSLKACNSWNRIKDRKVHVQSSSGKRFGALFPATPFTFSAAAKRSPFPKTFGKGRKTSISMASCSDHVLVQLTAGKRIFNC